MSVAVVSTGRANIRSLLNALDRLGISWTLTEDPGAVLEAPRLILPGVGAFGEVSDRLRARGLMDALSERLGRGRPLLGICLGMQLLLRSSEESPGAKGLGWIPGECRRLKAPKVPHMGWNRVEPVDGRPPFHAYFVHGYAAGPEDARDVWAWCEYAGGRFPAALRRGAASAFQFHPERSGPAGLALLREALAWD